MYVNSVCYFYLIWMKLNLSFSLCRVKILKLVYINKVLPSAVKSIFLSYATCNQFCNFRNGYNTARTHSHAHNTCGIQNVTIEGIIFFFVGVFLHIEGIVKYCHM